MRAIRGRGGPRLFDGHESPREEHLRLLAGASQVLAASFDLGEPLRQVARMMVPLLGDIALLDLLGPKGELARAATAIADPAKQAELRPRASRGGPCSNACSARAARS